MPAETLSDLKPKFIDYLDASKTSDDYFDIAMNEVMPRLYHMGFWRDMMTTLSNEDVSSGYFTLPEDVASTGLGYDSVLAAMLDDNPRPIGAIWHDYRLFGKPNSTSDEKSFLGGFIDDGFTSSHTPPRRRYRIGGVNSDSTATFLMRRKYVHVSSSAHKVYVPNDNSILKHALLGKLAEDNADVERAEYHWQTAQKLLDADLDSYRGMAKPRVHLAPEGVGGAVRGMY